MAGMGKRMRPHTLTVPKPLIPVAGKPIVQRLLESLVKISGEPVEEVAFVVGDFGKEVEENLISIAHEMNIKPVIYTQHQPLGTAHAVLCAEPSLNGKIIVAFADTLFNAGFKIENNPDGIIWVKKVANPESFGVVITGENNLITGFAEKPKTFVSDNAIIGIYYFKEGEKLKNELKYLVDNNVSVNGEYQLTDALENFRKKGFILKTGNVGEWFDCGNKDATLQTLTRILELSPPDELISPDAQVINSVIIPPCYLGRQTIIENSIIGPYVSVGNNSSVKNSIICTSIIQNHTAAEGINIKQSIVGNHAEISGSASSVNIGDYTTLHK